VRSTSHKRARLNERPLAASVVALQDVAAQSADGGGERQADRAYRRGSGTRSSTWPSALKRRFQRRQAGPAGEHAACQLGLSAHRVLVATASSPEDENAQTPGLIIRVGITRLLLCAMSQRLRPDYLRRLLQTNSKRADGGATHARFSPAERQRDVPRGNAWKSCCTSPRRHAETLACRQGRA
jgi:hypothetical protein